MTNAAKKVIMIAAMFVSLGCFTGCNTSSLVSGENDRTDTRETSTETFPTDTGSSPDDTGSDPEDTGSGPEDTGSDPEDTTPRHGGIAGTISLMETNSAEAVSVVLYDAGLSQVEAVETGESGEYEFLEVLPGVYTVRVSKTGYVNDERRFEVKAGEIIRLDFILAVDASQGAYRLEYVSGGSNGKDPHQQGTVGQSLKQALGVRLVDGKGAPVSFAEMVYEVVEGRQGGAVDSLGIVTGPKGEASNGYVLGTKAGENHVRVWSKAGGNSIHFYPRGQADLPASLTAVSGNNQTGVVGSALSLPVVVFAKDQYDNVVPGAAISFTAGSGGSAEPGKAETNASGLAQTSWTLGTKLQVEPPKQELVAQTGEVQLSLQATNISKAPRSIQIVSGDLQSARSGQALPKPFVVEVKDDLGNPAYGHNVAWTTSTGGSISPSTSSIGQNGLAQAQGVMGVLLEQEFFATIAGGAYVKFHADKVGDTKVSLTEPMLVWPGYPDASALQPEKLKVKMTIRGSGFGPEAKVVWNAGSADEEEIAPSSVTATNIEVSISAEHFEDLGTYPIAVRNLKSDAMESFGFQVAHTLLAPSSQDRSQCTKSVLSGWEWVECSEIGPDDEANGQDGHYEEQAEGRWEANDDGVAYDNITGLTWARCLAGRTYNAESGHCEGETALPGNHEKAQGLCEEMNLGGYADWRMPSLYELMTLRHESNSGYDIDILSMSGILWTDTFVSKGSYYTGYLSFEVFSFYTSVVTGPTALLCVRGHSAEREKYSSLTSKDSRIVADSSTGLVWRACPIGVIGKDCSVGKMKEYSWPEALSACEGLVAGGFDDWRLASSKELMTLLNYGMSPILPEFFGKKKDAEIDWSFWSSTTSRYDDTALSSILLGSNGLFSWAPKDMTSGYTELGALCVRAGY
jgi:hypothetical protein